MNFIIKKIESLKFQFGLIIEKSLDKIRSGKTISKDKARINEALSLISKYGGIDGGHHKQWVLDQVVRILTGDNYMAWVADAKDGEDGPNTYRWDEGISP